MKKTIGAGIFSVVEIDTKEKIIEKIPNVLKSNKDKNYLLVENLNKNSWLINFVIKNVEIKDKITLFYLYTCRERSGYVKCILEPLSKKKKIVFEISDGYMRETISSVITNSEYIKFYCELDPKIKIMTLGINIENNKEIITKSIENYRFPETNKIISLCRNKLLNIKEILFIPKYNSLLNLNQKKLLL